MILLLKHAHTTGSVLTVFINRFALRRLRIYLYCVSNYCSTGTQSLLKLPNTMLTSVPLTNMISMTKTDTYQVRTWNFMNIQVDIQSCQICQNVGVLIKFVRVSRKNKLLGIVLVFSLFHEMILVRESCILPVWLTAYKWTLRLQDWTGKQDLVVDTSKIL